MAETTNDACSTRAYVPGLGYILLSKREYENAAKDMGEYMRRLFEEGDRASEQEWRTAEYEIARVNNELVKAQKRIAALEAALKDAAASVNEWGAYASAYLQEKCDLPGEVARYIAIAEGKKDG